MQTKILLDEEQIPRKWYNVQADLPSPLDPPLHPATHKPVGPDDLKAIFPMELIRQEVTTDRYVDIPEEVRDVLRLWRPSPLYRAHRLEKFLKTPGDLLQVGRRQPGREPQDQHFDSAGLLQHEGRDGTDCDRNRGRAVGFCACLCDDALQSGVHYLHGTVPLHPETLQEIDDACLGCRVHPQPQDQRQIPGGQSWKRTLKRGGTRYRHIRSSRGCGNPCQYQLRAGFGPEPRLSPPDRDRARMQGASCHGRRLPGRGDRVRRWRLQLCPASRSRLPGTK